MYWKAYTFDYKAAYFESTLVCFLGVDPLVQSCQFQSIVFAQRIHAGSHAEPVQCKYATSLRVTHLFALHIIYLGSSAPGAGIG